jgi:hypothetical protein
MDKTLSLFISLGIIAFGFWVVVATVACPCRKRSGWRVAANRAMLLRDEGSLQAHWLDGCRSDPVAGSCVYRKLKAGRSGDEVRQEWGTI